MIDWLSSAQSEWENLDDGIWNWQRDGVSVKNGGREWYSLSWKRCDEAALRELGNFLIEVSIQGAGEAAGLSFGPFRDFLAEPRAQGVRLQLEVDPGAGRWLFRVDGQIREKSWWNSGVTSTGDILSGTLHLKARSPQQVVFRDLAFHVFEASCRLSVIMTSNRFLQRLRVALRNWCHQSAPSGAYEILVANPASPDGTHEYLRAVARSYPHVRLREVSLPSTMNMNKGAMINRALPFASGDWVWFTDADCLFAPGAVAAALEYAPAHPNRLIYGQRRYLTAEMTDTLLSGRRDSVTELDLLADSPVARAHENAPWGYTQIVRRAAVGRYPENFNHFAHCDNHFIEQCKARGILPEQMPGMVCLHLDHPFAWYGTSEFL